MKKKGILLRVLFSIKSSIVKNLKICQASYFIRWMCWSTKANNYMIILFMNQALDKQEHPNDMLSPAKKLIFLGHF